MRTVFGSSLFRNIAMVAAAALTATPHAAWAHVGFLLPSTFQVEEGGTVTTIASFSDRFPNVEHPLRSTDFHVLTPGGESRAFGEVHAHDQMTVLTARFDDPGVYRLSSGNRLGRKGQASIIDGSYVRLGRDGLGASSLPEGAPLLTSQTATVSEVYIRSGDADLPEVLTTSGRLSLSLNAGGADGFTSGSPLAVAVMFDGEPLASTDVIFVSSFGSYTEGDGTTHQTDDQGQVTLAADRAGPYVVLARHMAEAPEGAETDIRSYTTALVFEILP